MLASIQIQVFIQYNFTLEIKIKKPMTEKKALVLFIWGGSLFFDLLKQGSTTNLLMICSHNTALDCLTFTSETSINDVPRFLAIFACIFDLPTYLVLLYSGVHVLLVSLFGIPIVGSISHFFGWPKENCPISETGQFFLSTLLNFLSSLFWKLVTL